MTEAEQPFLVRHEFLIRRLHSLSGLVPVGAYMVIHLLTNLTVLSGPDAFQRNVYTIHSLGAFLPVVEWVFIFAPLLFHAVFGVVIIRGALPNTGSYPSGSNVRYALQRASGMIALLFILWHVLHMHGLIHADWWITAIRDLGGGQFRPYSAASTAGLALQNLVVVVLYAIGMLACVFHLANGIWTMGITWGVWTSPAAQRRASVVCGGFGVFLAIVGMSALWGMHSIGHGEKLQEARDRERQQYEARVAAGELTPNEEKRGDTTATADDSANETASSETDKQP